ncbi:MAG: TolC family outer membrane protein [Rhodomicrobiaceae bacterium]
MTAAGVQGVRAESLQDALASAYLYNPTLKAARAELRATDENVPRAISGYRPLIDGEVTQTFQDVDNHGAGGGGSSEPRSYSVTLNQPVFRGFRTLNAVKGAEALVEAGREDLRFAEQTVLLNAVTAYVDVVRDLSILGLQENNQKVLSEQLRATQDRFEVGEVTRTDVAQARARQSGASSAISAARATLQASRAVYAQIIGHMPGTLRSPAPGRPLPASLEEAIAIGEGENPTILAVLFRERAQDHTIKQTKGELLPSVDLQASYTRNENTSGGLDQQDVTTVTGVLRVPLYQGGEVSARIRQNIEIRSQLRHQIDEARQSVRANIISAWGSYTAARAQIVSDQAQVEASQVALTGVREEEKVGQRTVLDVLDSEQDLLNAQVNLATSRRNLIVASYALLAAIGRLSAYSVSLPVEQYDPTQHYREVRNKWIGWSTSVEESEIEPVVEPVTATGRAPGQPKGDGPAYTGTTR